MQIAYIIIAHKNLNQVQRLIGRLSDANAHFVVMVDRKTLPEEVGPFIAVMSQRPNVQIIQSFSIDWGRFSLTNANLIGLHELFTRQIPFDYVFSMSGQDYPLVSIAGIKRTLEHARGFSFVEHRAFPITAWIDGGIGRLYSWNIFLPKRRVLQLPKATVPRNCLIRSIYSILNCFVPRRGPLPNGMSPFGGSMHWILSREAAEYVQRFLQSNPQFIRRFKFTLISDEMFFQTILANSSLREKLVNSDQRYLQWPSEDSPSPSVLTMNDLLAIRNCGLLFARKFDSRVDKEVLDAIDSLADEEADDEH